MLERIVTALFNTFFIGRSIYTETEYHPVRGRNNTWEVRCNWGARLALRMPHFSDAVEDDGYATVSFVANSSAHITPNDELWKLMQVMARQYDISVFPLTVRADAYVPWDGSPTSLTRFDAIAVHKRPVRH